MRRLSISAMLGAGFCLASISSLSIAAQDAPKPAAKHEAQKPGQSAATPRTPDGRPDLSGIWNLGGGPPLIIRKDDQGRTTSFYSPNPTRTSPRETLSIAQNERQRPTSRLINLSCWRRLNPWTKTPTTMMEPFTACLQECPAWDRLGKLWSTRDTWCFCIREASPASTRSA